MGSQRHTFPTAGRLPDRRWSSRLAFASAVVLAGVNIAAPATSAPVQPAPRAAVTVAAAARAAVYGPAVSALSFNVCGVVCRKGEISNTAAYIARRTLSRNVTVVFLQELCFSQFHQVSKLVASRGYSTYFAATTTSGTCDNRDRAHGTGFGMAVLVRGKAWGRTVTPLPTRPGYEKRAMLGVTTTIGGRSTFVAVVHLSPNTAAGLDGQLRVLSTNLYARAGKPVIVGGDFNAAPSTPGMARFYSPRAGGTGRFTELDEAHFGLPSRRGQATFHAANRKIDYIFVSAAHFGAPKAASVSTPMSDHNLYLGTTRVARR